MPATSNIERALGVVIGKLDGIETRLDRQDESRAILHRRMDDLVLRQTHMESDVSTLKHKVEGMEKVTVQTTTLITKAEGAGTLGRWLLRFGGWILGGASGLGLLYTWITGRPPP